MAVPQVTPLVFRANFPEFTSAQVYPDNQINFWLGLAYKLLPANVWCDILPEGVQLYAAHNLSLEKQAKDSAATGGTPGVNTGPVNSKQVGPVSAGYDSAAASEEGGGNYNLTTYGTRFLRLAKLIGARVVQVNVGETPYATNAWPGPYPYPVPSGFSS